MKIQRLVNNDLPYKDNSLGGNKAENYNEMHKFQKEALYNQIQLLNE